MIRPIDPSVTDQDDRLGEAIESYLALAESGSAPEANEFAARYPGLESELREALDGLEMVRGLVGASGPGAGGAGLEAGRHIAGYRIVRELGRGGMGIVYEAVHVDLDRPVALKVLGVHVAPEPSGRRRFVEEAKTAAGLHHTHIVPVFDVGQVGGLCYYAMQRIEGCGLDRLIKALRRDRTTAAGTATGSDSNPRRRAEATAAGQSAALEVVDTTESWAADLSKSGTTLRAIRAHERAWEPPPFVPPKGSAYFQWVARVGVQAADALAHAHRRGVIHRDVKPSNLLIDERGVIWVADFGLALRLKEVGLTPTEGRQGTPRYMSPEQADGQPVDTRTDLYSLGATLYELLTLRPPHNGRSTAELTKQILGEEVAPPRRFSPRLPRDLEAIVEKAMSRRVVDRYASAQDLADDLNRFLRHEPVRARPLGPFGRVWRLARRHPAISTVSTAAAATILAVASYAHIRVLEERNEAVKAEYGTQQALEQTREAVRDTKTALGRQLWREASFIRLSSTANRRREGLERIEQAVRNTEPDAELLGKLRDEAVAFFAMRDLEARPPLATGRVLAMSFSRDSRRLLTLAEDGSTLGTFDLDTADRVSSTNLFEGLPQLENAPAPGRPRFRFPAISLMTTVGPFLAAIWREGDGIRFIDAETGAKALDLEMRDRRIISLAGSPGSRRIVTVEERGIQDRDFGPGRRRADYEVNLWDPNLGAEQPIAQLVSPEEGEPLGQMDRPLVSYAPEGDRIAVAWTNSQRVSILNGENGVLIDTIDTQSEVRSMVLGPNGLLAVAAGGSIRMWDIDSGRALPGITPHQGMIFTMNFSPDGGLLALGGSGNAVEIWDPASTTLLGANRASEWVMEVRFSPDGRTLAAAGTQVSLWSLVEPIGFTRMAASEAGITSMSFAPNGTLALSFFDGRPITLWNPKVCPSKAIRTEVGPGLAAAFDSEGRLGLISDDAISWVDASCNLLARLPFPGTRDSQRLTRPISPPRQASQAPSSPTAPLTGPPVEAIATDSGEPRTTTAAPPRAPSATKSSTPSKTGGRRGGPWLQLARAPDGRSLLIGRFGRFSLWTDSEPDKIRPVSLEGPGFVRGLAISSSRDRIYLAETERPLAAYAVDSELYVKDLRWAPLTGVLCLAVSHDGRTLAVGLQNGRVALVDTARGRIRHEFLIEDEETAERTITSLAFAPGDHELAVGLREGSVRLWHVSADPAKTPTPLVKLPSQSVLYTHLLFDADGGQLAVGGEKGVDVWKLDEIRGRLESLGMTW